MANIHQNLLSLIGNTPLMEVQNIAREENLKARVIVKIESRNPGGSVKDRIALAMVEDAEKEEDVCTEVVDVTTEFFFVFSSYHKVTQVLQAFAFFPELPLLEGGHIVRIRMSNVCIGLCRRTEVDVQAWVTVFVIIPQVLAFTSLET